MSSAGWWWYEDKSCWQCHFGAGAANFVGKFMFRPSWFTKLFRFRQASTSLTVYKPRQDPWISPTFVLLGIVPVFTFGLGTWQLQRLKWKVNLIDELSEKLELPPLPLPRKIKFVLVYLSISQCVDNLQPRCHPGIRLSKSFAQRRLGSYPLYGPFSPRPGGCSWCTRRDSAHSTRWVHRARRSRFHFTGGSFCLILSKGRG